MSDETGFSLAMSPAEAKVWHNSRGIPWGTPYAIFRKGQEHYHSQP